MQTVTYINKAEGSKPEVVENVTEVIVDMMTARIFRTEEGVGVKVLDKRELKSILVKFN